MESEPRENAAGLLLLYIAERSNGSKCHTTQQLMLNNLERPPPTRGSRVSGRMSTRFANSLLAIRSPHRQTSPHLTQIVVS